MACKSLHVCHNADTSARGPSAFWALLLLRPAININDLRGTIGQVCQLAALCIAIAAALKMFGLVALRAGVLEMAAVAIALAQVR